MFSCLLIQIYDMYSHPLLGAWLAQWSLGKYQSHRHSNFPPPMMWRMQLPHFCFWQPTLQASSSHQHTGPHPSSASFWWEGKSPLIDSSPQPGPPLSHPPGNIYWWLCDHSDMNTIPGLIALPGPWYTTFTLSPWVVLDRWVITATYFLVRLQESLYEFWINMALSQKKKKLGLLPVASKCRTQPFWRNIIALACFEILPPLLH